MTNKPTMAFWLLGTLALLWNSFGATDYVMTQTRNEAWIRTMMDTDPEPIFAWIDAQPWWMDALWALGVWSGVAGAILMLMRKAVAVPAFGLSLVGALGSFLVGFTAHVDDRPEVLGGDGPSPLMAGIVVIAAILFGYAKKQKANGVLT